MLIAMQLYVQKAYFWDVWMLFQVLRAAWVMLPVIKPKYEYFNEKYLMSRIKRVCLYFLQSEFEKSGKNNLTLKFLQIATTC